MPADKPIVDFHLRAGTQDAQVFEEVFTNNQYGLPDHLSDDSLIIDIGANVGAFAAACLMRGAGTVVCFEPCPNNFKQLIHNTLGWLGQVAAFQAAVWRSDRNEKLRFVAPGGKNTACGAVVDASSKIDAQVLPIESMGLDEILFHATDGGKRRVDILKIDAEGSEYPILYTCNHLSVVDKIVGETHQYPHAWPGEKFFVSGFPGEEACAAGMKRFLERHGFTVRQQAESNDNQICTLFFAERTPEKIS